MNLSYIRKIAGTPHTVLITGRTGTGKSHLARQIHDWSDRRNAKFVAVNLATLSENLIESELFGHEKGAFSGADCRRTGKLESANGGTVFLDEIGELSPRLQTKLLEALNSQIISPVGSNREILLNIRIIAATNRDLRQMVAAREFREDLYFRMNTFEAALPGLREEPSRILPLAREFARKSAEKLGRTAPEFSERFQAALESHGWPGNVRELKNAVEFAVAMGPEDRLEPENLPAHLAQGSAPLPSLPGAALPDDYREAKSYFEKAYLQEILKRFEGRINLTAKKTGLSKVTLIDKIRRYEIDVPTIKYQAHLSARQATI